MAGSDDRQTTSRWQRYLAPRGPAGLLRLVAVAVIAYLIFSHVLIPVRIHGASMLPTYPARGWNFCWRLRFHSEPPRTGDVVIIRLAGTKVMYLKRVVAVGGDTVEFRAGRLFINDEPAVEPYVSFSCDWVLEARTVKLQHVYVIGDNRSMPIEAHVFGETPVTRIAGGPLW